MALSQKLELRQSHALVMTPQLMQAIKLLQLSNLDLVAYVENELERNPLLERTGEGEAERRAADRQDASGADAAPAEWSEGGDEAGVSTEGKAAAELDAPREDTDAADSRPAPAVTPGYSEWAGTGPGGRDDGDYNLEAFV